MIRSSVFLRLLLAGMVTTAWTPGAHALLNGPTEIGLQATGLVDPDGFGPLPPLSSLVSTATTLPLTVSSVSVADASPGFFEYNASADIGLLALKVFGSLSNTAVSAIGNGEVPVMHVSAQVLDVLTLESASADPYEVSFEMVVNGNIVASGGAAGASANAHIDFGTLTGANGADSGFYPIGPVNDTLLVTRTVSGTSVDMDFNAILTFSVFRLDPGATVTGQLDNTARLRLILPEGVTLSKSATGTFGVPIAVVPEPGTWALMSGGLLLLGHLARRRGMQQAKTPDSAKIARSG